MGKKPQSPLCASCTGSSRAQQLPGEAFLGFESPAAGRAVPEAGQLLQHSACSPCSIPIHLESWADFEGAHRSPDPPHRATGPLHACLTYSRLTGKLQLSGRLTEDSLPTSCVG